MDSRRVWRRNWALLSIIYFWFELSNHTYGNACYVVFQPTLTFLTKATLRSSLWRASLVTAARSKAKMTSWRNEIRVSQHTSYCVSRGLKQNKDKNTKQVKRTLFKLNNTKQFAAFRGTPLCLPHKRTMKEWKIQAISFAAEWTAQTDFQAVGEAC